MNFRALRKPRIGMVLVAAAGPAMNIALAIVAALSFHLVFCLPVIAGQWAALNLKNAIVINVVLAVFNLFPLPPLDGGRIAVGLLPDILAQPLARLEPYGMMILIGLLIVLPLFGSQLGANLNFVSHFYFCRNRRCYQRHLAIDKKRLGLTRSGRIDGFLLLDRME